MKAAKIAQNLRLQQLADDNFVRTATNLINTRVGSKFQNQIVLPLGNNITKSNAIQCQELAYTQLAPLHLVNDDPTQLAFPTDQRFEDGVKTFVAEVINIPYISDLRLSNEIVIYALVAALYPFFMSNDKRKTSSSDFVIGIISCFATIDANFNDATATQGLKAANKKATLYACATVETYRVAMENLTEGEYSLVYNYFATNHIATPNKLYTLLGVCLLTLGKEVNDKNYTNWWPARLRAAAAVCVDVSAEELQLHKPEMKSMILAHSSMSTMFEFRSMLVRKMHTYRNSDSPFGKTINLTMQLLMYTEMSHVLAIELYVIIMMPEVMSLQLLRPYEKTLDDFINFVKEHRSYLPYVKFIIPPANCNAINRNTLRALHCAAIAIGSLMSDSLKNYAGGNQDTEFGKRIKNIITRYVDTRESISTTTLLQSRRGRMEAIEKAVLFEHDLARTARQQADTTDTFIKALEELTDEKEET